MRTPGILVLKQTMGYERCNLVRKTVSKGKVLDIGCGTGQNLILTSKNIDFGLGIDIAEDRLKIARKVAKLNNLKNLSFENKSALGNDLKKESFDWIICTEVIEHLTDDDSLLDNMTNLLNFNGRLIITTPAKKMFTIINKKLRNFVGEPEHVRDGYTIQELTEKLEKRKFVLENAGYYGQFFSTFIHYTSSFFAKNKDVKIEKGEPKLILYNWYKIVWPLLYLISRLDYLIPRKVEGGFIFLVASKIK